MQPIFEAGRVAIVADEAGFHGLITRVDVLNHLRRQRRAAEDHATEFAGDRARRIGPCLEQEPAAKQQLAGAARPTPSASHFAPVRYRRPDPAQRLLPPGRFTPASRPIRRPAR